MRDHLSSHNHYLTRRRLLQGAAALGLAAGAGTLLTACQGDPAPTAGSAQPTSGTFTPSAGTDIPKSTANFSMQPYGDALISLVGIKKGYFSEVGVDLPLGEAVRSIEETKAQMLNGQLDLVPSTIGQLIQTYDATPNIKGLVLTCNFLGNYVLASPNAGVQPFAAGGDFDTAMKDTIAQMKGKRVALSDTGVNREFFNTMISFGPLTADDFTLDVVADTKIVELGKAGAIDFAIPAGAAQNLELMKVGFTRMAGIKDLIDGLPAGDPRVVLGLDYTTVVGRSEWIEQDVEAVLRFSSVIYRIIDDLQNDTAASLEPILPQLRSAAGVDLDITDVTRLFTDFYSLISFEEAGKRLLDKNNPLYYTTVYQPQIEAAKAGGVVKGSTQLTPDDVVWQKRYYEIAVDLKSRYEKLIAAEKPTGELADQAAAWYKARNYLDAYRFATAAAN